jgi:hypothetical protein
VAAIQAARVSVFVFSAHSNESPHVRHELERSVSLGLPILPFRVDDVVPSPALEYFISSAHWLDALTPPMEKHIDRLVSTVAVLLDRDVEPGVPEPTARPRRSRRWWLVAALSALLVLGALVVGAVLALGSGSKVQARSDGASASATAGGKAGAAPFVDDFTGGIGAGWTWTNEVPDAWRVDAQGWLEIDSAESPPMHNLLLRDVPGTSFNVKVRLRFPATASGFAGLVLIGDDPGDWLEYGWYKGGLRAYEYKNGSMVSGAMMYNRDVHAPADRDVRLILTVDGSSFRVQYYDRQEAQYLDWGPPESVVTGSYTHVGLITYRNTGAAGTAAFDSFEIY